jgi:hypothetical protein
MKVIVLDDATWALVTKKLEEELACAQRDAERIRYWERKHNAGISAANGSANVTLKPSDYAEES